LSHAPLFKYSRIRLIHPRFTNPTGVATEGVLKVETPAFVTNLTSYSYIFTKTTTFVLHLSYLLLIYNDLSLQINYYRRNMHKNALFLLKNCTDPSLIDKSWPHHC